MPEENLTRCTLDRPPLPRPVRPSTSHSKTPPTHQPHTSTTATSRTTHRLLGDTSSKQARLDTTAKRAAFLYSERNGLSRGRYHPPVLPPLRSQTLTTSHKRPNKTHVALAENPSLSLLYDLPPLNPRSRITPPPSPPRCCPCTRRSCLLVSLGWLLALSEHPREIFRQTWRGTF